MIFFVTAVISTILYLIVRHLDEADRARRAQQLQDWIDRQS
ncbi:MAG: hypothetical protein RJA59_1267 [Pseudomonadota bacterium]